MGSNEVAEATEQLKGKREVCCTPTTAMKCVVLQTISSHHSPQGQMHWDWCTPSSGGCALSQGERAAEATTAAGRRLLG